MKSVETQAVARQTAASLYERRAVDRLPFLQRARRASALTIPSLIPQEGSTGSTEFPQPFQSLGSQGVNTLTAKFLLTLFPPGSSFFRFSLDDFVVDELKQKAEAKGVDFEDARAEFDTGLAKCERAITNRLEQVGSRTTLWELLLHLVVSGNGLLQVLKGAKLKFFPLSRYVVKRDLEGNVLEAITKETLSRESLPDEVRYMVHGKNNDGTMAPNPANQEESIDLYTVMRRDGNVWRMHQEVCGEIVPKSQGTYPLDKGAMFAMRYHAISGEDYGRGHVEEHQGDLESLETATQSIIEFGAIAAKIIPFVKEGGLTDKRAFAEARSGDVLDGDAKDISVWQLEKFADFQVQKAVIDEITPRLKAAFLMNTAIQRNAERVTAEEIRFMAQELEQVQGGAYSLFSQELQLPLVKRVMFQMQKERALPFLPDKTIVPNIITGLDGLGRSSEQMKLDVFLSGIRETFGDQAIAEYVNVGSVLKRKAANLGLDTDGLIRSEQEVQTNRAAAQKQELANTVAPHMVNAAVQGAQMANDNNQQDQ